MDWIEEMEPRDAMPPELQQEVLARLRQTGYTITPRRHVIRIMLPWLTEPFYHAITWGDAYRLCLRLWKRDELQPTEAAQ